MVGGHVVRRVVRIDVGLSTVYGARLAYLSLAQGRAFAVHRSERLELALSPYLQAPAVAGGAQ